jgi:hypothetical protein
VDPHQAIRDALAGDDPFASAKRVLAWLEAADAETFRKLTEKPEGFPTVSFPVFHSAFRTAFENAFAARWLELDPEGAVFAMERLSAAAKSLSDAPRLLDGLARVRPELVLEKLSMKSKNGYLSSHARMAFHMLAARNLKAAQRLADSVTDPSLRANVARAIASGVAEHDPLAAVALAQGESEQDVLRQAVAAAERIGPRMLRDVLDAVGSRLTRGVISPELLLRHPELATTLPELGGPKYGIHISAEALAAAERLSPDQRERLLASYDALPTELRDTVATAVALVWARTEPQKAAEWAVAHGKTDDGSHPGNTAAHQVFLRWVGNDAETALAWWGALPASALRDALGTSASTLVAEAGRIDEALAMFRPSAEAVKASGPGRRMRSSGVITISGGASKSTDEAAAVYLAAVLAERDPVAAGKWFATLPSSVATQETARMVMSAWLPRDPDAVARWVESLPAGAPRDEAARVFIQETAQISPTGAAEWVETVADPALRQQSALWVYWQWRTGDPAAARNWLSRLSGVDPEWKTRMLWRP